VSKNISDTLSLQVCFGEPATKTSFFCVALPHGKKMTEAAADQPLLKTGKAGPA